VDHKDNNTLNNRKTNLQICTTQQNVTKVGLRKNNSSGYKGVTRGKSGWQAQIQHNQIHQHIGTFITKEGAAIAYNKKAKELFGKFAILNEVKL
jgi:hypothetical protein